MKLLSYKLLATGARNVLNRSVYRSIDQTDAEREKMGSCKSSYLSSLLDTLSITYSSSIDIIISSFIP
jgi:hypothetical protein